MQKQLKQLNYLFYFEWFNLGYTTEVNGNGNNIVSWNWKAGTTGSGTTTGSSTKAYSYSVNTTAGFSIVKYKGNATNGLSSTTSFGSSPSMTMIKRTLELKIGLFKIIEVVGIKD